MSEATIDLMVYAIVARIAGCKSGPEVFAAIKDILTPFGAAAEREAAKLMRERCAAVAAERAGDAFMYAPEYGGTHQHDAGRVGAAQDIAAIIRALSLTEDTQ